MHTTLYSKDLHRSPVQHVQTTHIFNKLEVSRLDSRLSSFIIISLYKTLSWCQMVVRIQIAFKTIQPPETEKFEQGN